MQCAEILKPDGSMWLIINDDSAAEFVVACKHIGLTLRRWVKWYETFGNNCQNNFNCTSRHLLYFVKDPNRFKFNPEAVTRKSDRQAVYGDKRAAPGGKVWDDVWGVTPRIPRLVDNAVERLPDFPTQLPLALVKPIVAACSDVGDVVVDPFNGSGTTGHACIELRRRYYGIDISEQFLEASRQRLLAALAQRK